MKKKNIKKQKNKNNQFKTVSSSNNTTKMPKIQYKLKLKNTTPKYLPTNVTTNTIINYNNKNKKVTRTTTEISPYFYAINISKFKNSEKYLKFVKNITITYPVMIPARDISSKPRDPSKKSQKPKEKSRDINSNRNAKIFTSSIKPTQLTTITQKFVTNSPPKGKHFGN